MRAVIWTDVFQFFAMVGGTIAILIRVIVMLLKLADAIGFI